MHDLFIIITQCSRTSPIMRSMYPDEYQWSMESHMLANLHDNISFARWEQHGKGSQPKPFPRPGVKGYEPLSTRTSGDVTAKSVEKLMESGDLHGDELTLKEYMSIPDMEMFFPKIEDITENGDD